MIKKEVTYKDMEGKEVKETLRFNLTKAELIRMQAHCYRSLEDHLRTIIDNYEADHDTGKGDLFDFFEELIKQSYGVVKDGFFVKDPVQTARFMASEAYSEFILQLMSNENAAAEFVRGVVPQIEASK